MKNSIIAGTIFGVLALAVALLFYYSVAGNPYYILVPSAFVSAFAGGTVFWLLLGGERSSTRAAMTGLCVGVALVPLAWFLAVFWKFTLMGPTTSTELDFGQALRGAFSLGVSSSLKLMWYTIPAGVLTGFLIRLKLFPARY